MKFSHETNRKPKGFTLLEVIVTLVMASLLGLVVFQFMSTNVGLSAQPVIDAKAGLELNQVMERITADYKILLAAGGFTLAAFKSRVENANNSGNDPYYGQYTVDARYVSFESGAMSVSASTTNSLLVTIARGDYSLSALFTD